jgi:hypothetical protein
MAALRRAIELSLGDEDTAKLRSIAQSLTEPASRRAGADIAGLSHEIRTTKPLPRLMIATKPGR